MNISTAQVISLSVGTVLPLLTALVTRYTANPSVRAIVLLVLSAATSVLSEFGQALATNQSFDIGSTLISVLGTFVVGVGVHYGLWQATGVSDKLKSIGGFIGGKSAPAPVTPLVPPSGPTPVA